MSVVMMRLLYWNKVGFLKRFCRHEEEEDGEAREKWVVGEWVSG